MLSLHDISCAFGKKDILHDINLEIEEGSFYAIMGANGCGKTTLLRCIANLIKPTHGTVTIQDRNVNDYSARELAQTLSLVRQHPQTDFEFSAFETVLMGRNPYQRRLQNESQADWDIVEQCMKQTNTWHLRFALSSEMSGGELQRVMMARALAQQTPIMLLDEPISNLDIEHQLEIMELLRNINRTQHKTILVVIHDLNLALHYCSQLLLLDNHSVCYQGPIAKGLTKENILKVFHVNADVSDNQIHICDQ